MGDGPERASLEQKFPEARFFGFKDKEDLPALYQQADVFVFPSRTDTFGLVLLEAMACGTPVAAFPVTGPLDVVGDSPAGVLDEDLGRACREALKLSRRQARIHAEGFGWAAATKRFEQALVRLEGSLETAA